jgi:hypothetical protein
MIIAGSWRRGRWRDVGAACVDLLAFECAQHAQEFGTIFTPSGAFLPHWWPGRRGARGIQSTIFTPSLEQTLLHVFCSSLAGQLGTRFQNQIGSFVFFIRFGLEPRQWLMSSVGSAPAHALASRPKLVLLFFLIRFGLEPRQLLMWAVGSAPAHALASGTNGCVNLWAPPPSRARRTAHRTP